MAKRWRYSDELYLRINYNDQSYKEIQENLNEHHSLKAISWKAVEMGISNKQNWTGEEIKLLLDCGPKDTSEKTGRSLNACKIKMSRIKN